MSDANAAGTLPCDPMQGSAAALVIVYADDALLVVDKPAGLPCVPGRAALAFDALSLRAQACFPDALVVHRLDMATSGLVLFARGKNMQRLLSIAFAHRQVEKRYVAVVHGLLAQDSGAIELPLSADWEHRPRQRVDPVQGKPSLTHYRVLARNPLAQTTRLELQPVTGRSHQLRLHLQAIDHAIVGDPLYGNSLAAPAPTRLMLHACSLRFRHPLSREFAEFNSAVPF